MDRWPDTQHRGMGRWWWVGINRDMPAGGQGPWLPVWEAVAVVEHEPH